MAHRFPCAFQPIQITNGRQHMRRVGALASTRFEPTTALAQIQQRLQEVCFGFSSEQTRAKLRKHGKIKARVGEFQAERLFPIDALAHRFGSLSI